MPTTAEDVIGAWRLQSWALVYDDGRPDEYPLGTDAEGMIMYTPGGEVSAMLMRKARSPAAPVTAAEKAREYDDAFAYAGRYEVRDGSVFQTIALATNPAIIGVTTSRQITLDGDRLSLIGGDFSAGTGRRHVIEWRRSRAQG